MGRLSGDEQKELVMTAKTGDMVSFQILVEEMGPYVYYIAKKIFAGYEANGADLSDISKDDVYQAGFEGLISAVHKYDLGKGAAFSTFAYIFIEEEIKRQIRFELNTSGITKVDKFIAGESIDDNGLAERLEAIEPSTLEQMIEKDDRDEAKEKLSKAFASLSEKERKILFLINGIGCERTANHKKIASELGISEVMVRVMANEAIKKISNAMGE